jgi:energy-coupling factor transporter ATP-binding protein EcfA2
MLDALTEDGQLLGTCAVFNGEWYPGCQGSIPYSHYAPTLYRVLLARQRREETEPLRLQVLKAVAALTRSGRLLPVLLKFIIAPEHTLTGAQLEQVYGCPLQVFYTRFVGVSYDVLRPRDGGGDVRGRAIHEGYRRAAAEFVASGDLERARAAYLDGVRRVWTEWLTTLCLKLSSRPVTDHTQPLEVVDEILGYCCQRWEGQSLRLYLERLFYAPSRGISGRADRVEEPLGGGPLRVVEIKTRGMDAEQDPQTGERHPGGLQALAYREILHSFGEEGAEAVVEEIQGARIKPLPLEDHPLARRLRLDLSTRDERVVDLIAQARNIGYCVATGLFTGYDRYLLDRAGDDWRLRELGGSFELLRPWPPCPICPAQRRGVCAYGTRRAGPRLYSLFRYAPNRLFAYWAWFHRQLKAEERASRELLFHLVTTPAETLEQSEGITIGRLRLMEQDGLDAVFARDDRIETRIREDDRVLVTPERRAPGQIFSVEGTVEVVGEREIALRLNDRVDPEGTYRVDLLGGYDMRQWQLEGLTDFLVSVMASTGVRGRKVLVDELPRLARILLGAEPPSPPGEAPTSPAPDLNATQRRALAAALALQPGDLLLIQGPPGTGKTSLIAHLARAVLARYLFDYDGKAEQDRRPVLILTNTHRAADEVVLKLLDRFPEVAPFIIRVGGRRADMDERVARQTLAERAGAREALDGADLAVNGAIALFRLIRRAQTYHDHAGIFVGTLGSADAAELRGLSFELVIVDEAGQATEPAMLQALRHLPSGYAGRLVLVGDHCQLPPVVSDELIPPPVPEAFRQLGLEAGDSLRTSAFERLARLYPHALITLTEQYRMNAPICTLVSETFYDGRLVPGTDEVAGRTLAGWLAGLGMPEPSGSIWSGPPVVLITTEADPNARDSGARFTAGRSADEARDNPREAEIIAALLAELVRPFPQERRLDVAREIGVISPYRRQNNRIRQELLRHDEALAAVRVDTVDRFQGGEREVIVVSLVNSNDEAAIGRLHAEWRRMNVAISRARRALVIVGDRSTFTRDSGRPEEDEARRYYRVLFDEIERLERQGQARVLDSRRLP